VALKLLRSDVAADPGYRARFQRESRIATAGATCAVADEPSNFLKVAAARFARTDDGKLRLTVSVLTFAGR
jgi:hypothetical protein